MKRIAVAAMLGMALNTPVHAVERDDPGPGVAESVVRGLVQEHDVALIFDYLRETLDAAAAGRDPPPADRLAQRADEIGVEVKRRGVIAGHAVLDAIELSVRDLFRDAQRLPPTSPLQRSHY